MNFARFQPWREECLRAKPDLLDCAETNLYRALAPLQPSPAVAQPDSPVHRCDLARAWLSRYGFSGNHARHALICRGVRHALSLIFKELARTDAELWIPGDVYPMYLELAQAAGIEPRIFPTLPEPRLPATANMGCREYLLLTNPWKPLGRFLTGQECVALTGWLAASASRYLLIDCVYDLGAPFHFTTQRLLQTGRVILLHSATKGWLWPKTFGVALLGGDCAPLESAFRNDSPSPEQLRLGEQFLTDVADLPGRVMRELATRKQKLLAALPAAVVDSFLCDPAATAPGGYFFPVNIAAGELLRQHGVLAIPASVFGADWEGSILTSLAGVFAPAQSGGVQ